MFDHHCNALAICAADCLSRRRHPDIKLVAQLGESAQIGESSLYSKSQITKYSKVLANCGRAERREDQVACWRFPQLGEELSAEHLVALDDVIDELGISSSCKSLSVYIFQQMEGSLKKTMFSFGHSVLACA